MTKLLSISFWVRICTSRGRRCKGNSWLHGNISRGHCRWQCFDAFSDHPPSTRDVCAVSPGLHHAFLSPKLLRCFHHLVLDAFQLPALASDSMRKKKKLRTSGKVQPSAIFIASALCKHERANRLFPLVLSIDKIPDRKIRPKERTCVRFEHWVGL